MNEKPILMNAFSVKAILAERKTQTRRMIKVQPLGHVKSANYWADGYWRIEHTPAKAPIGKYVGVTIKCPQGTVGDQLWVRETWRVEQVLDDMAPREFDQHYPVDYRAGPEDGWMHPAFAGKWRPSIHMPRWASRIQLEVTDVRVEQVQDMVDADAVKEGIPWNSARSETMAFATLWDSIYAKRGFGWAANPWVFAISFKIFDKP